jgi:mevalonate kinase
LEVVSQNEIPIGHGLGSSAAFTVAMSAAVNKLLESGLSRYELAETAIRAATLAGIPGGPMDEYSCAVGGLRAYRFQNGRLLDDQQFAVPDDTVFVIATTTPRFSGTLVSELKRRPSDEARTVRFIRRGFRIEETMRRVLGIHPVDLGVLGKLITEYHRNLQDLGVSTPELDLAVDRAIDSRALGAKLMGAGGGGSIVALTTKEIAGEVGRALADFSQQIYYCAPTSWGIKVKSLVA